MTPPCDYHEQTVTQLALAAAQLERVSRIVDRIVNGNGQPSLILQVDRIAARVDAMELREQARVEAQRVITVRVIGTAIGAAILSVAAIVWDYIGGSK